MNKSRLRIGLLILASASLVVGLWALPFPRSFDEFRLASPPWPVQQALFAVLASAGKLLGYRASYPEYSG